MSLTLDTNFATPGINVFTQPLRVTPGFQYNINSAFVYSCASGFQGELGYNFFARRADCIELCQAWKVGPALKHTLGQGRTNPVRDITGKIMLEDTGDFYPAQTALANYENNVILDTDLDLYSAASPCTLSHTVFGSLGYRWDEREYPLAAHLGGSYEFSKANNGIVERWTLWAKAVVSF